MHFALVLAGLLAATPASQELRPALFGEGVFTTGSYDFFVALSPDQKTAYFCRATADFASWTIVESHKNGNRWSAPVMAPFSGRWSDADPHFSPDGSKLYFISNRPDSGDVAKESCDLWVVEANKAPKRFAREVTTDATEWSPSVARNGNLYFGTTREGGKGRDDLWMSRLVNGHYEAPVNLGDSINTKTGEIEPWIAPDERYLVFSAGGRADGKGGLDLYISYRKGDGWTAAKPLGHGINSDGFDFNPSVSPDGKTFFFTSTRQRPASTKARTYAELESELNGPGNGLGDIYSIPIEALEIP